MKLQIHNDSTRSTNPLRLCGTYYEDLLLDESLRNGALCKNPDCQQYIGRHAHRCGVHYLQPSVMHHQQASVMHHLQASGDLPVLWKAIVDGNVLLRDGSWTIRGREQFIDKVAKLLDRACYRRILDQLDLGENDEQQENSAVEKKTRFRVMLITGSAGVGKTFWLYRLLIAIHSKSGLRNRNILFVESDQNILLKPDGSSEVFDELRTARPDIILSDSVEVKRVNCTDRLVVVVASLGTSPQYHQFLETLYDSGNGVHVTMDLFTLEELKLIKKNDVNDAEAEFRYDVLGGNARSFVSVDRAKAPKGSVADEIMEVIVTDLMEKYFPETPISFRTKVSNFLTARLSKRLPSATLRENVSSVFVHWDDDRGYMWASKFLHRLAKTIIRKNYLPRHWDCWIGVFDCLWEDEEEEDDVGPAEKASSVKRVSKRKTTETSGVTIKRAKRGPAARAAHPQSRRGRGSGTS